MIARSTFSVDKQWTIRGGGEVDMGLNHVSRLGWAYLSLSWGVVVAATVYALTRLDAVWLVAVAAAAVACAWWVRR
jgi:hypothetical protein